MVVCGFTTRGKTDICMCSCVHMCNTGDVEGVNLHYSQIQLFKTMGVVVKLFRFGAQCLVTVCVHCLAKA